MTAAAPAREIVLPYPHGGQSTVRQQATRFNWLAAGRRWRKSTLLVAISVEAACAGKRMFWGAPVYDQVYVGWEETKRACGQVAQFNQSRMTAEFPGGGRIIYRSLDDPDNARGHTADGIVIDECGDVDPDAWYDVLRPMLIDTGGWFWGIGTPRGLNWFWREHERARTTLDSMAWQIPTVGVAIRDGMLERAPHPLENPDIPFSEIESLFLTMPEADFRQEILAEFVEAGHTVFSPSWWLGKNRYDVDDAEMGRHVIGRYLSFDTGMKDKKTSDYSSCVVGELLDDYRLRIREVWRDRLSFPNLIGEIERLAHKWNADGRLKEIFIEDRVSGTSAYQTLTAAQADPWLAGLIQPFNPTVSKGQRASEAGVWCRQDCVLLPHPSPWVPWLLPLEEELFAFSPIDSENEHDDQVDALSQLIIALQVRGIMETGFRARHQAMLARNGLLREPRNGPAGARPAGGY